MLIFLSLIFETKNLYSKLKFQNKNFRPNVTLATTIENTNKTYIYRIENTVYITFCAVHLPKISQY